MLVYKLHVVLQTISNNPSLSGKTMHYSTHFLFKILVKTKPCRCGSVHRWKLIQILSVTDWNSWTMQSVKLLEVIRIRDWLLPYLSSTDYNFGFGFLWTVTISLRFDLTENGSSEQTSSTRQITSLRDCRIKAESIRGVAIAYTWGWGGEN